MIQDNDNIVLNKGDESTKVIVKQMIHLINCEKDNDAE